MNLLVQGLLFDMDGTTVDSNPVVEAMWQRFCEPRGIDLSELLVFSHGRLAQATLQRYMPEATPAEIAAEQAALLAWESAQNEGVQAVAGIPRFLDQVASVAVPWALVTSAVHSLAETRFRVTGLVLPPVVVTAERVDKGKPDGEGYRLAASELGVPIGNCVVFEDAGPGVAAGKDAGAKVVVVGDDDSAPTQGCPRIRDFTSVRIQPAAQQGWFVLNV